MQHLLFVENSYLKEDVNPNYKKTQIFYKIGTNMTKSIDYKMQEKKKNELPIIESTEIPESLDCTTCLLPMQYQKKVEEKFVWQCFRCGKKYFVFTEDGKRFFHLQ